MIAKAILILKGKHALHVSHHYVHITYLGLVFIESHGVYGIAAGVLGVIVAAGGVIEHFEAQRGKSHGGTSNKL